MEIISIIKTSTDEDAKKYFETYPDQMIEPERVRLRHILIKIDNNKKEQED